MDSTGAFKVRRYLRRIKNVYCNFPAVKSFSSISYGCVLSIVTPKALNSILWIPLYTSSEDNSGGLLKQLMPRLSTVIIHSLADTYSIQTNAARNVPCLQTVDCSKTNS